MGEIADLADRRDVAVHRIDDSKAIDLRRRGIGGSSRLEVARIVVAEDAALGAMSARIPAIIEAWFRLVGIDVRQPGMILRAQRLQRRLVGDVARGEEQRGFLAMQGGELALQFDVHAACGAGDVARAAGAGALGVDRGLHGLDHGGCWPMPR
jgi:hypothetical protein